MPVISPPAAPPSLISCTQTTKCCIKSVSVSVRKPVCSVFRCSVGACFIMRVINCLQKFGPRSLKSFKPAAQHREPASLLHIYVQIFHHNITVQPHITHLKFQSNISCHEVSVCSAASSRSGVSVFTLTWLPLVMTATTHRLITTLFLSLAGHMFPDVLQHLHCGDRVCGLVLLGIHPALHSGPQQADLLPSAPEPDRCGGHPAILHHTCGGQHLQRGETHGLWQHLFG